jgi:hypothetical protein
MGRSKFTEGNNNPSDFGQPKKKKGFNDLYLQDNFFDRWHTIELSVKSPSVAPPYLLCFRPLSPLSNKDILLNLGMKCWNSAFNAQGSRVIIVVVQVGAVKIYVAAVQTCTGKRKHSLPPKLVEKLVWVPVIFQAYNYDKGDTKFVLQ